MTIYVSPNGNDKNPGTLAQPVRTGDRALWLLRQAGLGGTVVLLDGTHAPMIPWTGGTAGNLLTIRAANKWKAVVDCNLAPAPTPAVAGQSGAEYVCVDGLQVLGLPDANGIKLQGNGGAVRNCWISGAGRKPGTPIQSPGTGPSGMGIQCFYDDFTCENNLIEDCGQSDRYDHGIYASGKRQIIRNNIIRRCSGGGIQMADTPQDCRVYGNLVYGCGFGVLFVGSPQEQPENSRANLCLDNTIIGHPIGLYWFGGNPFLRAAGNVILPKADTSALDAIVSSNPADYQAAMQAIIAANLLPAVTPEVAVSAAYNWPDGTKEVQVRVRGNTPLDAAAFGRRNFLVVGPDGYCESPTFCRWVQFSSVNSMDLAAYYLKTPPGGWKTPAEYAVVWMGDSVPHDPALTGGSAGHLLG